MSKKATANPSFELRPKARRDLKGVWAYSKHVWGEGQAETYIRILFQMFERLAATPSLGRPVGDAGKKYLRANVAEHAVFYVVTQKGVRIARVLHQKMDIVSILQKED